MAQSDEYNLESGQSGVVSPCGTTPVDPPAHLYQATSTVIAPVATGTVLPVSSVTSGNTTTFGFQTPQGQPGSGGLTLTTVNLPPINFPNVAPNAGYSVAFSWNPSTQGAFTLCAFCDLVTNDRSAEFNRNASGCSNAQQAWSVTTHPNLSGGYAPSPLNVAAQLLGNWVPAVNGPPIVNGSVTIAGAWAITAI